MNPAVERDAHEFGLHVRSRGWRLALIVARCVQPRAGQGRRPDDLGGNAAKVSSREFAAAAGVDRRTVSAYLAAWDRAAADSIVPARIELEPGENPELDFDPLPPWEEYYEPRRGWRSPSGGDDEWYTRTQFVEAARQVLGAIDLDPASNARAQEVVQATRYYSLTDRGEDGLELPWAGRVFLNPPFSNARAFGTKLMQDYEAGRVDAAIMVFNAYSGDSRWYVPFQDYPWCLARGSAFYKPGEAVRSNPVVWAGFVYLGLDFDAFTDRFSQLGRVYKDPTGRAWQKRFSRPPGTRTAA